MSQPKADVLIIGNGFAGIVAANRLADAGVHAVLLDENIHIGGQLLRQVPERLGRAVRHDDYVKKTGQRFIDAVKAKKITVLNRTRVLGIYPGHEVLVEENEKKIRTLKAERIILATGGREKFLPFPGWTLPGVISGGAVQVLIKSSGVLPAREILIGGSGLFLFSVAYECLQAGGRVRAVLERTGVFDKLPLLAQLPRQLPKLSEGARFLSRILFSGVPLRFRTRVLEARGRGRLEQVVTAKVDGSGKIIPGRGKTYEIPLLAVSNGFAANVELAQMAGCDIRFLDERGGWVAATGDDLETSVPGIYAAGEITGIAGALKSINEVEIAALAILHKMGKTGEADFHSLLKKLLAARRRHLQFGKYFNLLYKIPTADYLAIPDETLICRCEDVTMGELRKAVANGYYTPATLKIALRTAIGDCQGRTCGPIVYDILAALTDRSQAGMTPLVVRPPVKPVAIDSLAGYSE